MAQACHQYIAMSNWILLNPLRRNLFHIGRNHPGRGEGVLQYIYVDTISITLTIQYHFTFTYSRGNQIKVYLHTYGVRQVVDQPSTAKHIQAQITVVGITHGHQCQSKNNKERTRVYCSSSMVVFLLLINIQIPLVIFYLFITELYIARLSQIWNCVIDCEFWVIGRILQNMSFIYSSYLLTFTTITRKIIADKNQLP